MESRSTTSKDQYFPSKKAALFIFLVDIKNWPYFSVSEGNGKKNMSTICSSPNNSCRAAIVCNIFPLRFLFCISTLFSIICLRFIGCDCIGHCASMWRNSGAKEASQRSGVTLHPNPVIFFPYILTCIQIHMVNLFMPFWERQKIMPLCISMYGGQLKVVTRVKLFNIHLWHPASEHCCCQQQTN